MPAILRAHSSLFSPTNVLTTFPPGPYHTSDDTSDDESVLALEEAPEHLRRVTNKDAPIIVESSDEEQDEEHVNSSQPGPSMQRRRKRHSEDTDDEDTTSQVAQRRARSIRKKKNKSDTIDTSPPQAGPVDIFYDPHPTLTRTPSATSPAIVTPNTTEYQLNHVLEILPDIDLEWALQRINEEMVLRKSDNAANRVMEIALEMEEGYPKAKASKGKSKDTGPPIPGQEEEYRSLVYKSDERIGASYYQRSLAQLEEDFPTIPAHHIRYAYQTNKSLYVPSYFHLLEQTRLPAKPYTPLKRGRHSRKGKNTMLEVNNGGDHHDSSAIAFDNELDWLQTTLAIEKVDQDAAAARRIATEEALAGGAGIDCGCCFGETLLEEMIQCEEGHLFCRDCVTQHAETKLGEQSTTINCMDQSDCGSAFPESELSRVLNAKSLQLYHRLKQAKELEDADIEDLESCPSCPYAAVIDNPHEKLFRCMNAECGQVTCRACKRKEHIPKTCAEVEADLKLNNRHTVEDAMSEAMIRKCPKCSKPYVKDLGCNKIHCNKCGTFSCYICQKAINGYDHFDQVPGSGGARQPGKCVLWDQQEKQHDDEAIRAARDAAAARVLATARENGIELNAEDVNVALPDLIAVNRGIGGVDMARMMNNAQRLPPRPAYEDARQAAEVANRHRNLPRQIQLIQQQMAQQQQIAHQDAARRQILVRQLALQDRAAELARMEQRAQLLQQQRDNLLQIANNRRPGSPANPRLHNDPIIGRNVRAGLDTLE